MRQLYRNLIKKWAAIIATSLFGLSAGAGALAYSTGNGGSQPPLQYSSSLPNLSPGQTTYQQGDSRGRIIISPSSFPSIQPVSFPTSQPVTVQFPTVQSVSFPTPQPFYCTSGCSGSTSNFSGQYYVTPPTYTVATAAPISLDPHGNVNMVAATPLPLLPVTLNVPNPIPVTDLSPLPVVEATTVPNAAGAATQGGINTNDQLFGFDGFATNEWWPIAVEQYGVVVVTPGGVSTMYYAANTSSGLPVKQYPGRLVQLENMSSTAQTVNFICYDNATTASGNVLFSGKLSAFPNAGWQVVLNTKAANGIFCQPSAATNSGGAIVIQYE